MKAVVLVAGKGERLLPLTENRPKHMLPVGGIPLLEWTLMGLRDSGVNKVILVTHYMEEQIRGYFKDGSSKGIDISYIRQEEMGGTANAFGTAQSFLDGEDFIGIYGDLHVDKKTFKSLLHRHTKGEASMCVVPVDNPSTLGVVEIKNDYIKRIVEKPALGSEPSNLANAGIYLFPNEVFQYICNTKVSERGEYEITDTLQEMILSGMPVRAVEISRESWLDVGYPWDLLEANERAMVNLETSIKGEIEDGVVLEGPVQIETGARIRSGTYIEGPVYIGSRSDIGPNCYLRPTTVIGADSRIGNACEVKNSIVMSGTHIAHLSYVGDSILGERCNLGAGTITANIRFDKKNVKMNIKGKKIDSGRRKLGAIMGDDSQTGINVSLMPGIRIGSRSWIAPGHTIYEDIEPDVT
jgi:bifunctional UDP-N-acetylglucosamine pyrophosphorylase/glucosamine-1-phosphate N-acetyltransferase